MAKQQEKLNKQGRKYIAGLAATTVKLWELACKEDGIATDSKFIVFSENNRAASFYNLAIQQYQEARQQYAVGGYVGLRLVSR